MSKPTYPVTIDTLIEHKMGAFLSCPTCRHAGDIDLERLAGRLGRDWTFINRRWPVRCARCGNRNVEVRITPCRMPSYP